MAPSPWNSVPGCTRSNQETRALYSLRTYRDVHVGLVHGHAHDVRGQRHLQAAAATQVATDGLVADDLALLGEESIGGEAAVLIVTDM
jgi:hypothetical protein